MTLNGLRIYLEKGLFRKVSCSFPSSERFHRFKVDSCYGEF